jgi:acyl-CoA thioester hydrolase
LGNGKLRADIIEWENRLKIDYLITDAVSGCQLLRGSTASCRRHAYARDVFMSPAVLFQIENFP